MITFKEIKEYVKKDLELYIKKGGKIEYPFQVDDFALKTFGISILYDKIFFEVIMKKHKTYILGALHIKDKPIIYINPEIKDFKIGDMLVPKEYYIKESERQTIAHEVGHYSKYFYTKKTNNFLFEDAQKADNYYSIMLDNTKYSEEVFANKYARELLMPEKEAKKIKNELEIVGTIDVMRYGKRFREYFGITEFMLEVRLKELKIPFVNGYYIPDQLKKNNKSYSEENLIKLMSISIGNGFGLNPNYGDCEMITMLYNKVTGETRDSGPIYMTIWRISQGKYDYYEKILSKRISFLEETRKKSTELIEALIIEKLKKEGANKITLFGSFVKQQKTDKKIVFSSESDIDILVSFKKNKSIFEITKIKNEIEDIIKRKIDLLLEGELRNYMKYSIEQDNKVIYEA